MKGNQISIMCDSFQVVKMWLIKYTLILCSKSHNTLNGAAARDKRKVVSADQNDEGKSSDAESIPESAGRASHMRFSETFSYNLYIIIKPLSMNCTLLS